MQPRLHFSLEKLFRLSLQPNNNLLSTNTLCHLAFNLLFPCIYILSHCISVNLPYLLAVQINWLTSTSHLQWMRGSWASPRSKTRRCFASSAVTSRSCSRTKLLLVEEAGREARGDGSIAGHQLVSHARAHTHTRQRSRCYFTWTLSTSVSLARVGTHSQPLIRKPHFHQFGNSARNAAELCRRFTHRRLLLRILLDGS